MLCMLYASNVENKELNLINKQEWSYTQQTGNDSSELFAHKVNSTWDQILGWSHSFELNSLNKSIEKLMVQILTIVVRLLSASHIPASSL